MIFDYDKAKVTAPLSVIVTVCVILLSIAGTLGLRYAQYYIEENLITKANAQEVLNPIYLQNSLYYIDQWEGRIFLMEKEIREMKRDARIEKRSLAEYEIQTIEGFYIKIKELQGKITKLEQAP